MEDIKKIIERSKTFAELLARKKAEGESLTEDEQSALKAVERNAAELDKRWKAEED